MNQEIRVRVEAALQALKRGELIILSDDSQREHEGDLVDGFYVCDNSKCERCVADWSRCVVCTNGH